MNLLFENHCVSNSPSKIEGAGGSMKTPSPGNHTPQSLRDSSSILEEQPDIQPFIFVELTLFSYQFSVISYQFSVISF